MCGGSKPKPIRASAQDLALAAKASNDRATFEKYFLEIEKDAVSRARSEGVSKITSSILEGRANADIEQGITSNRQGAAGAAAGGTDLGSGRAVSELGQENLTASLASETASIDAAKQAQGLRDDELLNVTRTGTNQTRTTTNDLIGAAQRANSRAATKLQAAQLRSNARLQAIGQVAGTAVAAGVSHFGSTPKVDGSSASSALSLAAPVPPSSLATHALNRPAPTGSLGQTALGI